MPCDETPEPPSARTVFNAYCDESCHLEHDRIGVMGFGLVSVGADEVRRISTELREIKARHGCRGELKWTKVSPRNVGFYLEVVDYFFKEDALSFRALIVRDKDRLDHDSYNHGSHDLFYYKMYYYLLRNVAEYDADKEWRVYLDIKDTRSSLKIARLREILRTNFRDFSGKLLGRFQQIRSNESELMQVADFLLGAVMYATRKESGSIAKLAVVRQISRRSRQGLRSTTPPWESKFNLFHFKPRRD